MPSTDDLYCIVGKTIKGVLINRNKEGQAPSVQVFLVLDDNTYYELYGEIMAGSRCHIGGQDAVMSCLSGRKGELKIYNTAMTRGSS